MASKRKFAGENSGALVPVKKPKQNQIALTGQGGAIQALPQRTSSLEAPIMLLSGHEGEVFTTTFHPSGETLASAGFDRLIYLWNVYGDCENFAVLKGHTGAVMELHFSLDGSTMFTASTDKTLGIWDFETGTRIKKLKGHSSFVNSCFPSRRGPQYIVSGADDCTVKVTAVSFNDTSDQILSGGIDNEIKVWDLRKNDVLYKMSGHTDTVTCLRLSPDGSFILSNAMDNTVRMWDIRPFAPLERCLKVFTGAQHNFEKNLIKCSWSPDGLMISSGSADRFVYVWDTNSRRILYKLPGHDGSVNDVDFHPNELILMSCGSDKKIYLGELQP
ncbi:U5 small nuclear ribonucleoprotein 40 kDa protein-like isoform X2 [Porites lutea]|uniref:U5 small nuclear ribonucleoprotein 40 kDa protein-like isoform X2 n=1 Tax=Porites lutea TaxID=51062 RepID=UPI003CC594E1